MPFCDPSNAKRRFMPVLPANRGARRQRWRMADDFTYDVFLSHSSEDRAAVRSVAERLRADGLRVWLDDWQIRPGDSIPAKIEDGLEHSRVLVLCMSAQAFGSDWALLEASTFRFRDPLNKERFFIPLRIDESPVKGSLAQFLFINWLPLNREEEYPKLLEACRPPQGEGTLDPLAERATQLDYPQTIWDYAFIPDGELVLTAAGDSRMRLWNGETGFCLRLFEGHNGPVTCARWSADL